MAFNYTELDSVTEKFYLPLIIDQLFSKDPILAKLKDNKKTVSGGTKFTQNILVDTLNHGKYKANRAGNSFDIAEKDIINAVDYAVKGHYANLTIDGWEETINSGTAAVHNLLEEKMKNLEEAMRQELLGALYQDPATFDPQSLGFEGLIKAVDNDNVYAGLDRAQSANAFWRSVVKQDAVAGIDLGATDAYTKVLRDFFMKVTDGGKDHRNLVFVGDFSTISKIEGMLASRNQITTVDQTSANLGFESFKLFGKPVHASSELEDIAQTTGKGVLYAINFDYFGMRTLKGRDFYMTPFKSAQANDSRSKQLLVMGNYVCNKPKSCGVIRDIII
jgi:hypothetical protein